MEIVAERDAKAAVERFKTEPFHLLLIDVSPFQDGEAIRELIHTSRVRQRSPSIAFSTGRIDRETLKMLANDHCFAVFPKPFDPQEVERTIREAFEAHSRSVDAAVSPILHGILDLLHPREER